MENRLLCSSVSCRNNFFFLNFGGKYAFIMAIICFNQVMLKLVNTYKEIMSVDAVEI